MRILPASLALALLFAAVPARAEPKDIAELFPANSLAYIEINQPGVVAKDLAAFLKGTAFSKTEPLLDRLFRKPRSEPINTSDSGILTTILGPEMLRQAARFKGVAAALTGFDKNGSPEYVAIALTGDSQLPGSLMKAYLSARPDFRKIATVEGFDLYQQRQSIIEEDRWGLQVGPQPEQPLRHFGPLYAYQQGIILTGSSKEQVSMAIRRWKNMEKSASLAAKSTFKEIAKQREVQGVFLFADARALLERFNFAKREGREMEPFASVLLRRLIPAASVGTLIGRLDLKDQAIDLRFALKLDPKANSPLADLLSGPGLAVTDLSCLGKDSPLALTLNLPLGEQRLPRLLTVLDAFTKATGTLGPTASEIVKELESQKLLASAVLAKINRVTILMPPISSWPKSGMPTPSILVHAETNEALETIEAAIPAVLEMLSGTKSDPVTETIDGIKIRSLEGKASPMGQQVHYARKGNALCIGHDRKFLADGLRADPATSIASINELIPTLKGIEKASAVGVWNWVDTLRPPTPPKQTANDRPRQGSTQPVIIDGPAFGHRPEMRGASRLPPRELLNLLQGLPPMLVTFGRDGDELRLELKQIDPRGLRAKAIDRWLEWFGRSSSGGYNRGGIIYDESIDLVPAPPIAIPVPK